MELNSIQEKQYNVETIFTYLIYEGAIIMTACTINSIVVISITTKGSFGRFKILYICLFCQLLYWFSLGGQNLFYIRVPAVYVLTVFGINFKVPGIWLFCCEYFVGMTQVLPQAKSNRCLRVMKKIKLPINILIMTIYIAFGITYTFYFFSYSDDSRAELKKHHYYKKYNAMGEAIGFLNGIILFASIIVLSSALCLVYKDFKHHNSLAKSRFLAPINLNVPNFIIHTFILLTSTIVNQCASIQMFFEYRDIQSFENEVIKDHDQLYRNKFWFYTMDNIVICTQIIMDLFVQFIFWRITTMSCPRLEKTLDNLVTNDDIDTIVKAERKSGILKLTNDAEDFAQLELQSQNDDLLFENDESENYNTEQDEQVDEETADQRGLDYLLATQFSESVIEDFLETKEDDQPELQQEEVIATSQQQQSCTSQGSDSKKQKIFEQEDAVAILNESLSEGSDDFEEASRQYLMRDFKDTSMYKGPLSPASWGSSPRN